MIRQVVKLGLQAQFCGGTGSIFIISFQNNKLKLFKIGGILSDFLLNSYAGRKLYYLSCSIWLLPNNLLYLYLPSQIKITVNPLCFITSNHSRIVFCQSISFFLLFSEFFSCLSLPTSYHSHLRKENNIRTILCHFTW